MRNNIRKNTDKSNEKSNEKEAINEIIGLIKKEQLSIAEIRGAAWEAVLMLMYSPLKGQ